MYSNSIGHILQLTTFGESHGPAMGGVITGFPAGLRVDLEAIQQEVNKRKPGQSYLTTPRNEEDKVELLSGLFEGITLGTPIGFIIRNIQPKSEDYEILKDVFRPSHADYTWQQKYGIRDYRGGGRSSARETICRVVAGALAKQLLQHWHISVDAYVSSVGNVHCEESYTSLDLSKTYESIVRCPHPETAQAMIQHIEQARMEGDTLGGVITCIIRQVPVGLGQPVFAKLNADLTHALAGINAVKGVEFGDGFSITQKKGSEVKDVWSSGEDVEKLRTLSNHSGGIQGGISNGEDIVIRVAFKPVSTLQQPLEVMNSRGEETILNPKGRHDPCVLPRAAIIVESMAAWVLANHLLWAATDTLDKIKKAWT
ncbi:MAG: chorismate synthase [Flavobacteriales bacterium]|nr:chorismate synthase [Flavobacteriales bacterium]